MGMNFSVYKNSVIATVVDFVGSLLIAVSVYFTITEIFEGIFSNILLYISVLAAGFCLKIIGLKINEWFLDRNLKDVKKNRSFIFLIKECSMNAYEVYQEKPTDEIFEYIKKYNPFTAMRIEEIKAGILTEKDAIAMMEEYDEIFTEDDFE